MPALWWAADYSNSGATRYRTVYPDASDGRGGIGEGVDYGRVIDPDDPTRCVMRLDNWRGLSRGNSNSRAAFEGPQVIRSAANGNTHDVYWLGVSFRVDRSFSLLPATDGSTWAVITTAAYGPPYVGSPTTGVGLWPTGTPGRLRMMLGVMSDGFLPADTFIDTDTWYTLVMRFRFAYASEGGHMRVWLGRSPDGSGMAELPVKNGGNIDVMRAGNNDGWHLDPASSHPNSARVECYSAPGTRIAAHYGHHAVASDPALPDDYLRGLVTRPGALPH